MAQADFGTGKSLVVLAIVLGCFAILWPKIFYPMMQTAFAMTSPKVDADGRFRENERIPPHLHPAAGSPRSRNPGPDEMNDKFLMRDGRPFPHPQQRQPIKATPKTGGAMSIIMPIYTVGIVVFFLYTVLKLVFKKPENEADKTKPLIKDFHLDPEYRKFVCQQPNPMTSNNDTEDKKKSSKSETAEDKDSPAKDLDSKDYEILKLRKKLEETEDAMERIMKHMGAMNQCLTDRVKLEQQIAATNACDIRQRHKRKAKDEVPQATTHKEEVDSASLDDDLTELINLCKETGKSIKGYRKEYKGNEGDDDDDNEGVYEDEDEINASSDEEEREIISLSSNDRCNKTDS